MLSAFLISVITLFSINLENVSQYWRIKKNFLMYYLVNISLINLIAILIIKFLSLEIHIINIFSIILIVHLMFLVFLSKNILSFKLKYLKYNKIFILKYFSTYLNSLLMILSTSLELIVGSILLVDSKIGILIQNLWNFF